MLEAASAVDQQWYGTEAGAIIISFLKAGVMNETEPAKSLSRTTKKRLKKQQKLAQIAQESKGRWWRFAIKCIALAIAGLSAVETLIFFFPDFAIAKEDPLDVADAFSVPFVVRYNGWIPLFDVSTLMRIEPDDDARR